MLGKVLVRNVGIGCERYADKENKSIYSVTSHEVFASRARERQIWTDSPVFPVEEEPEGQRVR